MKGKKCIGLLILCITCLLSLSLSSNASAVTFHAWKVPSTANYDFVPGNVAQTISFTNNFMSPILYFNPDLGLTQSITNFKINLSSSTYMSRTKKFKFDMLFQTYTNFSQSSFMASPLCPFGANGFVVDECSFEAVSETTAVNEFQQLPQSAGGTTIWEYVGDFESTSYFIMHISGHYNSNSDSTLNHIDFQRPIYFVSNTIDTTQTTYPVDVRMRMAISTIQIYSDDENSEDEAAQKELEDRNNLEDQSSATDSEAGTAGQSAENTGTTLFGAFTQLFSALSNVSGNSCTLPTMQIYTLDLGQMDLCTYTIPPQIMALVSIGMVFIIVPLGIHLVKKMISLYKEITG